MNDESNDVLAEFHEIQKTTAEVNSRISATTARIAEKLKALDDIADTADFVNDEQLDKINNSFDTLQTSEHEELLNELVRWTKGTKVNFEEFDYAYFNQVESWQQFYTKSLEEKVDGLEQQIGNFDGYLDKMKDKIDFFHNKMNEFFTMLPTDGPYGIMYHQFTPGQQNFGPRGNDQDKIKFLEAQIQCFSDALKKLQELLKGASDEIKKLKQCEAETKRQLDNLKNDFDKLRQASESKDELINKLKEEREKELLEKGIKVPKLEIFKSEMIEFSIGGEIDINESKKNDEDNESSGSKKKRSRRNNNDDYEEDDYDNQSKGSRRKNKSRNYEDLNLVYVNQNVFSFQNDASESIEDNEKYKELLEQLKKLKEENENLEKLKEENESLKEALNSSSNEDQLKELIDQLTKEKEELAKHLSEIEEKNKELQEKLDESEKEKEDINNKLKEIEKEKEDISNKLKEIEKEKEELEDKISKSEAYIQKINQEIQTMKEELENSQKELEKTQGELEKSQSDLVKIAEDLVRAQEKADESRSKEHVEFSLEDGETSTNIFVFERPEIEDNSKESKSSSIELDPESLFYYDCDMLFNSQITQTDLLSSEIFDKTTYEKAERPTYQYQSTQIDLEPFPLGVDNLIFYEVKLQSQKTSRSNSHSEYLSNDDNFIAIRSSSVISGQSNGPSNGENGNFVTNRQIENDENGASEEDLEEDDGIYPPFHVKVQYTPTNKNFKKLWQPKPPPSSATPLNSPRIKRNGDRKALSARGGLLTPNSIGIDNKGRKSQLLAPLLGNPPFAEMSAEFRPKYPLLVVQSLNRPPLGGYKIESDDVSAFKRRASGVTIVVPKRLSSLRKKPKEGVKKENDNGNENENVDENGDETK